MALDIRPFQYEEVTPPPGVDAYVAYRGKKPVLFFEFNPRNYNISGQRQQTLDEFLEVGEDFFLAQEINPREVVVDIQAEGCRYRDTNLTNLLWGGNETMTALERVFPSSWSEEVSPFQNGQPMYVTLVYGKFNKAPKRSGSFISKDSIILASDVSNPKIKKTGCTLPYGVALKDYALLRHLTEKKLGTAEYDAVKRFLTKQLAEGQRGIKKRKVCVPRDEPSARVSSRDNSPLLMDTEGDPWGIYECF